MNRRALLAGLAVASCSKSVFAMASDFSGLPPDRRAEAEAIHGRMMTALPYERTTIDGQNAPAELARLRTLGRGWPVAIGGDEALERIAEQFSASDPAVFGVLPGIDVPRSPARILVAANELTFPNDLAKWSGAYPPDELAAEVGAWPEDGAGAQLGSFLAVTFDMLANAPLAQVHVLFIPTQNSWEVPAYLRWGDWNACPPPEYHVAALRKWHDTYGAELVGVSADLLDIQVDSPPTDREAALAVAREIYQYCPDSVDQGTQTLSVLAASMVMRHSWSLWWD